MKSFRLMLVAVGLVVAFGVSPANSAEPVRKGKISDSMFASMGLDGMEEVSDRQGDRIRGQGFTMPQINGAAVYIIGNGNKVSLNQTNAIASKVNYGKHRGNAWGRSR